MKSTKLTASQKNVIAKINSLGGQISKGAAKQFDPRVVNNLVRAGLLTVVGDNFQTGERQGQDTVAREERDAAKVAKSAKPRREKVDKTPSVCLCGCGNHTKSHKSKFVQGHDASLRKLVLRFARGKDESPQFSLEPATVEYLNSNTHWMTDELRAIVHKATK